MKVVIDTIYCKGCNLCVAVCVGKALTQGTVRNEKGYLAPECDETACVGCMNCGETCPELAITVEKEKK